MFCRESNANLGGLNSSLRFADARMLLVCVSPGCEIDAGFQEMVRKMKGGGRGGREGLSRGMRWAGERIQF